MIEEKITERYLTGDNHVYSNSMRHDILTLFDRQYPRVLDIGCSTGNTGIILKKEGLCKWVTGIELSKETGEIAKKFLDEVIVGPVEVIIDNIPDQSFDCVCCLDVLEHLLDPWTVMETISKKIKPGGIIITSIPNIRYISIILKLIFLGQWEYKNSGILDRTHLRFFTKKTALDLHSLPCFRLEKVQYLIPNYFKIINFLSLGMFNGFLTSQYLIRSRKT